jgi:hypothetical protein
MTWAVAAQLRYRGVRTLGIMHSDDEAYRTLLRERPIWDGGVAVSAECALQMKNIATDAFADPPPVEQITYGVPVSSGPPAKESCGPLRLVYVGRLIEHQKRVSRLIELAACLRDLGCEFTLDLIGDGPSESGLRSEIETQRLGESVRLRGRLTPEEVQAQLDRAHGLVLVSDFEGTSIAMLEAMGRGVIPCVSEVASGVGEWVRDGENGVSAPVGDVRGLAAKIAEAGSDRPRLERMQRAAWETVHDRGSIAAMFDRYGCVLQAIMQRPLHPERSDLGLHLTEGGRWLKSWAEDAQGARRWATAVLREAGFREIACGEPAPGCDAVIVDTGCASEAASRADQWRAMGLGVAFVPLLVRPGWVRLGAAMRRAMEAGASRIAVYGAGLHTQRALPMLIDHLPIVGVIDDRASGGTVAELPIVRPDEATARLACDAVVLSSDTVEDALWAASAGLRAAGVPVYRVYAPQAEDQSAPAMR